jgi:hypothetical protein
MASMVDIIEDVHLLIITYSIAMIYQSTHIDFSYFSINTTLHVMLKQKIAYNSS